MRKQIRGKGGCRRCSKCQLAKVRGICYFGRQIHPILHERYKKCRKRFLCEIDRIMVMN